jgi:hypothetical protein
MICCDTCPFWPTCEELEPPDWGEEFPEDIFSPTENIDDDWMYNDQ